MISIDFDLARYVAYRKGLMEKRVRDGAAYAYVGEHKVRRALIGARPVLIAIEGTSRLWRGSARKQLLGASTKATDQHHRRVYQAANRAARGLDMDAPPVYIASREVNIDARALGTDDDACVVINESLIDRLSDDEVTAVLAQQFSHVQNAHIPYATALYYLEHEAMFFVRWIVKPAIMTLQAWSRRAEITCDRAALLVTRKLDVALSAVIKLASPGQVDVSAYLADMPEPKAGVGRFLEYFRTRPALAKRVAALRLFAQSTFYKHTVGEDIAGGLSADELDRRVGEILSVS